MSLKPYRRIYKNILRCRPLIADADNPFAVAIGLAKGSGKAGKISYVLCQQPKSFDWHRIIRLA